MIGSARHRVFVWSQTFHNIAMPEAIAITTPHAGRSNSYARFTFSNEHSIMKGGSAGGYPHGNLGKICRMYRPDPAVLELRQHALQKSLNAFTFF